MKTLVIALISVSSGLYALLAILRHYSLNSRMYDLAILDNVFWNSINGRFFHSDIEGHNYFGEHFNLILLPFIPLYYLWSSPTVLLIVQSLALVLGAWPLYLLGRKRALPDLLNLSLVIAYLLYLPLFGVNLNDFHELAFTPLLTLWALYFLEEERTGLFALFIALSFLTKENVLLNGVFIGAYLALDKQRWRLGALIALISFGVFELYTLYLVPRFAGAAYPYFAARYGLEAGSLGELVTRFADNPGEVVELVHRGPEATREKLIYVGLALYPLLFLPLISGWAVLLFAFPLASILLSNFRIAYCTPFTQYGAAYAPFLFFAAVLALSTIRRKWLLTAIAVYVLAQAVATTAVWHNFPACKRGFTPKAYVAGLKSYRDFRQLHAMIPPQASLAATRNLVPHLSQRQEIIGFSYGGGAGAEYLLIDLSFAKRREIERVYRYVDHLDYGVIGFDGRFVLAQRGALRTRNEEVLECVRSISGKGKPCARSS